MKVYQTNQIEEVVAAFRDHNVIAFPTDTVYGVGVLYGDTEDLDHLKQAKHRPETKPIPMMVSNLEQMKQIAKLDDRTLRICQAFLPGALTLVLPVSDTLDPAFTNGMKTVAVRMPKDDFILQVISRLDTPLLVTSANQSGAPTALTYEDALEQLPHIDGIVQGSCQALQASTIVDCTQKELVLLREGPVSLEQLKQVAYER